MTGIYKITTPLDEVYIGQSYDISRRFIEYKRFWSKTPERLYQSFLKYGIDNHKFEIIHLCEEHELDYFEIFYIKEFNSYNCEKGLNLTIGGSGWRKKFLSYNEAKEWLRENFVGDDILNSQRKWIMCRSLIPTFIPKHPKKYYSKEWISWNDFLCIVPKKKVRVLSYEKCREWVQKNTLTKHIKFIKKGKEKEWNKIKLDLPLFIPKYPDDYYRNKGWSGWNHFFGIGNMIKGNFLNYEEAKKWVKTNKLTKRIKTISYWKRQSNKLPFFIPEQPDYAYEKTGEWKGWNDFLSVNLYY